MIVVALNFFFVFFKGKKGRKMITVESSSTALDSTARSFQQKETAVLLILSANAQYADNSITMEQKNFFIKITFKIKELACFKKSFPELR